MAIPTVNDALWLGHFDDVSWPTEPIQCQNQDVFRHLFTVYEIIRHIRPTKSIPPPQNFENQFVLFL